MKKFRAVIAVALLLVLVLSISASAHGTGKSYVYNHSGTAQEIPDPYQIKTTVGYDLGMVTPVDMVIRKDKQSGEEFLYVLDTGHKKEDFQGHTTRLLVLDKDYNTVEEKTVWFTNVDGSAFTFQEPRGLWIDEEGRIFVTDRSAHYLYIFTVPEKEEDAADEEAADEDNAAKQDELVGQKFEINMSLGIPDSPMITYKADAYLPTKVLTDHLGVIYLRVENDYRGFLMLEPDYEDYTAEFLGYFGANEVVRTAEAVAAQFWKRFMTEAQLERTAKALPMEYSNFCIDDAGAFIYGVRGSTNDMTELVRKINCKGKNVLDYQGRFGDIGLTRANGKVQTTNFNAITVDDAGFITTFDATWQRLFQYTPEGNLMYVFGGKGTQEATFERGADIESWGDNLLVLDEVYATITVMEPTTFGANVREGEIYYSEGKYEKSQEKFEKVVAECMNYEFGYQGIGKGYYREREYTKAMDNFYLAHDQANYSMAFKMYRAEMLRSLTVPAVIAVAVIAVVLLVLSILKNKGVIKTKKVVLDESGKLKYVLHTLIHPIEGYEEMRYNKKYSLTIANIAIFFFFFSSVIMSLYSGFIFNGTSAQSYNMIFTIAGVLGGFTLFALVNWLMATFFEGKGKFKEVWIYLGYATIPYSVTCFLYTLLSNVLTQEEATFLGYLMIVGQGWALVMVWFALQGLHMYSPLRNLASVVVTLAGMLVVLFIIFLMFNLFIQFFAFGESVFTELLYRIAVGF